MGVDRMAPHLDGMVLTVAELPTASGTFRPAISAAETSAPRPDSSSPHGRTSLVPPLGCAARVASGRRGEGGDRKQPQAPPRLAPGRNARQMPNCSSSRVPGRERRSAATSPGDARAPLSYHLRAGVGECCAVAISGRSRRETCGTLAKGAELRAARADPSVNAAASVIWILQVGTLGQRCVTARGQKRSTSSRSFPADARPPGTSRDTAGPRQRQSGGLARASDELCLTRRLMWPGAVASWQSTWLQPGVRG